MSLRVGLGASKDDLDVQGEIDFDFFEESDCSNSNTKTSSVLPNSNNTLQSIDEKSPDCIGNKLSCKTMLKENDLCQSKFLESSSSQYFKKPLITVSCDDTTGLIQKTTIETIIPTPYNYKENKCGKISPVNSKKGKKLLSPRLKSKIFNDDHELSDDSSLSSMSESESELSTGTEDSLELNEESDSMTDVSPLMSPFLCNSPVPEPNVKIDKISQDNPVADKEEVELTTNFEKKECPKCSAIDIQELLKAVKRLEMGQNINSLCPQKCSSSSVITQNAKSRKNMSFSNEKVRCIDNDNQTLLKKIVAQQNRPLPQANPAVRVVSSSAVNRQKQQRQIQLENVALLKRLESTKASRDLSRAHLLRDYERRSSTVSSRTSSRLSKISSQRSSCRTSNNASGRSSAISIKSSNSSAMHSDNKSQ